MNAPKLPQIWFKVKHSRSFWLSTIQPSHGLRNDWANQRASCKRDLRFYSVTVTVGVSVSMKCSANQFLGVGIAVVKAGQSFHHTITRLTQFGFQLSWSRNKLIIMIIHGDSRHSTRQSVTWASQWLSDTPVTLTVRCRCATLFDSVKLSHCTLYQSLSMNQSLNQWLS